MNCRVRLAVIAVSVFLGIAADFDHESSAAEAFASQRAGRSPFERQPAGGWTHARSETGVFSSKPRTDLAGPQPLPPVETISFERGEADRRPDFRELMRPRFGFDVEWEPETDGLAIASYDGRVTVPTFPVFGPPPMIAAGFSFTDLHAPASFDLPSSLYEASLGLSGMRQLNERWMLRWMVSSAFASDWENTSGDAWRFRGGLFGIWQCSEAWQITLGALATGREDIPVLPAAGAIWQPASRVRIDLMMPRPRVNFMVADLGSRQHWIYAGGGLDGGTWSYERAGGTDELLTYREWRLVLGWESKPPGGFGGPPAPGLKLGAEVGYVLGRTFEFDSPAPDIEPSDSLLLRAMLKF